MMTEFEKLLSEAPGQHVVLGDTERCGVELEKRLAGHASAVLFTGRHSAERCGAYAVVAEAAKRASCRLAHFNAIEPEPCIGTVLAMRDFLAAERPEVVIAAGGGSILDAAKAAYLMLQSGLLLAEHFGVHKYSNRFPDAALKRILAIVGAVIGLIILFKLITLIVSVAALLKRRKNRTDDPPRDQKRRKKRDRK